MSERKRGLVIAPYRQSCSWGQASRAYIKALTLANFDLTLRPVWMSDSVQEVIEPSISALEDKVYPEYDFCLQICLPHLLEFNARFNKNIALFFTETENWKNSWNKKIKMMSEVIVPSNADIQRLRNSIGYDPIPIHQVPIPVDVEKFSKEYKLIDDIEQDHYNFYYIGDIIERKNVEKMIAAFHIAFKPHEKVNLVIKTSPKYKDKLLAMIDKVKKTLRIRYDENSYKKEILIVENLTDDQICSLHKSCNCLIMPSSGESWSLVCADAAGFKNWVITTDKVGICEHIACTRMETKDDYILTGDYPLIDLYTANEVWGEVNIRSMVWAMQRAVKQQYFFPEFFNVNKFSYENVAAQLREVICPQLDQ